MSIKTYGSLFAGVGGIDLGLDEAGLECLFQVEIDNNCQQTLSYHWPNTSKYLDVKNVKGYNVPIVELITFGSPCQDLSTAGKRAGLNGNQSSLFYEAIRIIKEMREKTNGEYPKWSIWENVPGALSSNGGADFGQVLYEMDEAGACFSEWAILDAQYFGVPQRRRRLFVISCFDPAVASRCPESLLPVCKGSSGDFEKSSKKEQVSSDSIASCITSGGSGGLPSSREESLIVQSFTPSSHAQYRQGVGTIRANGGDIGGGSENLIVEKSKSLGVRRLTPIECERLMGWPDNHTLHRFDGKENSDTIRYKMCGNGVASPVIKWIANQIKEI